MGSFTNKYRKRYIKLTRNSSLYNRITICIGESYIGNWIL